MLLSIGDPGCEDVVFDPGQLVVDPLQPPEQRVLAVPSGDQVVQRVDEPEIFGAIRHERERGEHELHEVVVGRRRGGTTPAADRHPLQAGPGVDLGEQTGVILGQLDDVVVRFGCRHDDAVLAQE